MVGLWDLRAGSEKVAAAHNGCDMDLFATSPDAAEQARREHLTPCRMIRRLGVK